MDDSQRTYRSLKVYPNPNKGVFQIEYDLPENSKGFVVVHNLEGKEIFKFKCQEGTQVKTINISNLESGTYLYSYYIDGHIEKTGKVIVK